jgi:NAD+ kinase
VCQAQDARRELEAKYPSFPPEEADVLVALGGDGFMLYTIHQHMTRGLPIFGMNRGTVGFLLNAFSTEDLMTRLAHAERSGIHPLRMVALDRHGQTHTALAVNEVSVFRQTGQAAHLGVEINHRLRLDRLICDGILLATPAGSTAYNLSAHGTVLPLHSSLLALTPISAFRPRRWKGAVLQSSSHVSFTNLHPEKRPISATADFTEVRDVVQVASYLDASVTIPLLFDPGTNLDERILQEQFLT